LRRRRRRCGNRRRCRCWRCRLRGDCDGCLEPCLRRRHRGSKIARWRCAGHTKGILVHHRRAKRPTWLLHGCRRGGGPLPSGPRRHKHCRRCSRHEGSLCGSQGRRGDRSRAMRHLGRHPGRGRIASPQFAEALHATVAVSILPIHEEGAVTIVRGDRGREPALAVSPTRLDGIARKVRGGNQRDARRHEAIWCNRGSTGPRALRGSSDL